MATHEQIQAQLQWQIAFLQQAAGELHAKVTELTARNADLEARNADLEPWSRDLKAENEKLKSQNRVLEALHMETTNRLLERVTAAATDMADEEQQWHEEWKEGKAVWCFGSGYDSGYMTLEKAKSRRDAQDPFEDDHDGEILWRRDGRWYLDDLESYLNWHEVKPHDHLYYPTSDQELAVHKKVEKHNMWMTITNDGPDTDRHAHCSVCNDYGEIDGNEICDCMRCKKMWCLACWEFKGGDPEYCAECQVVRDRPDSPQQ